MKIKLNPKNITSLVEKFVLSLCQFADSEINHFANSLKL